MDLLAIFPQVNASLNSLSTVFLLFGFFFIMTKRVAAHRFCMLSAVIVSAVFLISYLTYHTIRTYYFGLGPSKFTGEGIARPIYYTILTSHTILAVIVTPFIIWTLRRALKGKFDLHKKLARFVYPVWLYVSITGVIVYVMLYQLYPGR